MMTTEFSSTSISRQSEALRLVSYSTPCPDISIQDFLHHARGSARFYWEDHASGIAYAGMGTTAEITAWGEARFQKIEEAARNLFAGAVIENGGTELATPRLFGGFAFRDDFAPDNTWSVYHPADFILPHYQYTRAGDEAWLTINIQIGRDENPEAILEQLREALLVRYEVISKNALPLIKKHVSPLFVKYPMPYTVWETKIQEATTAIHRNEMEKVVLARACEIRFGERVNVDIAMQHLNEHYQNSYRFLFEPRPYHTFYGATPELLVKVQGTHLETMSLAGSIRRGKTKAEDQALAREIMTDPKERHEHAVVVSAMHDRLQPLTKQLDMPQGPGIYKLSNIQHLHTPIKGELKSTLGIIPVVETLHPTPALGGKPREAAIDFIRHAEPVPRGWYAAPIGYIDHNLDGAFAVAIRSAVSEEQRVWLYAGVGIVADSIPEKEWNETRLKFRPMLQALSIQGDIIDASP